MRDRNFAEIMRASGPQSRGERLILAVGFLEDGEDVAPDGSAIEDLFTRWNQEAVPNFPQVVWRLIQQGFIEDESGPGPVRRYRLTKSGRSEFERLTETPRAVNGSIVHQAQGLKELLSQLGDAEERSYLLEAVNCYSVGANRAAILMSWSGVVRDLHSRIRLSPWKGFKEAYRIKYEEGHNRDWLKKHPCHLKDPEDLKDAEDRDVIEVAYRVNLLDRGERENLFYKLRLRNACAHQSRYTPPAEDAFGFAKSCISIVVNRK